MDGNVFSSSLLEEDEIEDMDPNLVEELGDCDEGFMHNECYEEEGEQEEEVCSDEDEMSSDSNNGAEVDDGVSINGMEDIIKLDLANISVDDVARCHFLNVDVAFHFYNWYARVRGFSARRDKVLKTKKGETVQQTFVCYREGHRVCKKVDSDDENFGKQKRDSKKSTRCGCEAKFRVHVNILTGRWYVTYFFDLHNHELLDYKACGMLAGHRKMNEADVIQMNSYMNVGIGTPLIYGSFVNQSGGHHNVGARLKDIYNQIARQRKKELSDAKAAIAFIRELEKKDPMMFWKHTSDDGGRLQNLFWCDGICRLNYSIFGDVLAFDATYSKNKYLCPIVFFSGVNHHNQTTIFAAAFIANETEETYVWLLQQLMEAMDGKAPVSVITDGDVAMRNAIKRILPNARHRLCAWHLLRNATSNVSIPQFTQDLRDCMLGDYEVGRFYKLWERMLAKYGLQENSWVQDLYTKRRMWATALLRGSFFAGFRTTSRCEGFHAMISKYVHKKTSLAQFVYRFHRCLDRMRFHEEEADFESLHGDDLMKTNYVALERSGSKIYTKAMFKVFRKKLVKSGSVRVVGVRQTTSCYIYTLSKYRNESSVWRVSYNEDTQELKCSCLRFESLGIPCEHILSVLAYLNFGDLPSCLIVDRWTKNARRSIEGYVANCSGSMDSSMTARYVALNERSKEMHLLGCRTMEKFYSTLDVITQQTKALKIGDGGDGEPTEKVKSTLEKDLLDPACARTKGCHGGSSRGFVKGKRKMRCGICRGIGHNRKGCPTQRFERSSSHAVYGGTTIQEENADFDEDVGTDVYGDNE